MSLRARLGVAAGVAVALAVIATTLSAYAGTRSELRGQVDASLHQLAAPLVGRGERPFGFRGGGIPPAGGPTFGPFTAPTAGDCDHRLGFDFGGGPGFGGAAGLAQFVSSAGGRPCLTRGSQPLPVDGHVRGLAKSGHGQYFTDVSVAGHHLRELVVGVPSLGALQVALPLADVDHTLSKELLLLAVIAAAGVALAALLGLLVARTALAPIARFTRQTETIAANPDRIEHERLDAGGGGDELSRLADTFNTTLDSLASSVRAQRNLVADASHELRTPIASVRANLQLLRDEQLLSTEDREALRADIIGELDELTALVGDVVELARGSQPDESRGEIRLDEVIGAAVARARRRSPELTVHAELEPALVRGNGDRIARAVSNLLDNAAKWSPPGATVDVVLHGGSVTVRDHGLGFHDEDLPYLFDRFHRARDARAKPGSGLGLAIVRQAAEAHGGFARAENAPGGGALLTVCFGEAVPVREALEASPVAPGRGA